MLNHIHHLLRRLVALQAFEKRDEPATGRLIYVDPSAHPDLRRMTQRELDDLPTAWKQVRRGKFRT